MHVHAINKQVYELTCASESVAKKVQREIEGHIAVQINNIISSVLSEHFKTGHLKIDKIEIDLGDVLLSDFGDAGMLDAFKMFLEEEISAAGSIIRRNQYISLGDDTALPQRSEKFVKSKMPVTGNRNNSTKQDIHVVDTVARNRFENNKDKSFPAIVKGDWAANDTNEDATGSPVNVENELDIIRLFLLHGDVPWWADKKTSIDFDERIQKLMLIHPDSVKLFLEEYKEQWQVLWRLTKHYNPATRVMLDALAPGLLPASTNRQIFNDDEALSGYPLTPIIWVKLHAVLKKRTTGSVDQLRRSLLKNLIKVVNVLQTNTGNFSILSGTGRPGSSPGGSRHQLRKKTTERLKFLVSKLAVFQIEFLLFQLSLDPDLGTDTVHTAESAAGSELDDISGHKDDSQLIDMTGEEATGGNKTTQKHPATNSGEDEQPAENISKYPGNVHGGTTPAESPDLLPGDRVNAAYTLPEQLPNDDNLINYNSGDQQLIISSTGIKPALPDIQEMQLRDSRLKIPSGSAKQEDAAGIASAEKVTVDDNRFTGDEKVPALLHKKKVASFSDIAEELARSQKQAFEEKHKLLLFFPDKKHTAVTGKPESPVTKPGGTFKGDNSGLHAPYEMHLKHEGNEKDKIISGTYKGEDIPGTGKSDGNLLNEQQRLHTSEIGGGNAIQNNLTPNAPANEQQRLHPLEIDGENAIQNSLLPNAPANEHNRAALPPFTAPQKNPPATRENKFIKKQSIQSDQQDAFTSAQEDETRSTQLLGSRDNTVKRKIAFIMKRLQTTEAFFFEYLNHLQEPELNRLEETLKKHIRQKLQRRNKIRAILEHPHFLKYNLLKVFANLYVDQGKKNVKPDKSENTVADKKKPATAVIEKLQGSQSAFLFLTDTLSARQVITLQGIFQKQQIDSSDEKTVIKKILGKISEEGLLLIKFLTELPEVEIRELLQNSKKLSEVTIPSNQPTVFQERNEPYKIYVENAGLCLIANYLRGLFKRLDYLENGSFKTKAIAVRAIFLIQYMVTGKKKSQEHILQLNKILCGFKTADCIILDIRLTKKEVEEADNLLQSVVENWKALKNTSLTGFRESFLQRKGIIFESESYWTLQVERKGYDLLLDTIPWGFRMIKMPWVKKYMQVEW